ncbi:recombinase family protein [Peribacillus frigoritolerans]|nr:recombinase family protein [Peribacillus frigoritolerans]
MLLIFFALADSTRQLVELLEEIESKGSYLHSLTEQIDTRKKNSYSFLTIAQHLVAFQSNVISEKNKKRDLMKRNKKGNIAGRPRKT